MKVVSLHLLDMHTIGCGNELSPMGCTALPNPFALYYMCVPTGGLLRALLILSWNPSGTHSHSPQGYVIHNGSLPSAEGSMYQALWTGQTNTTVHIKFVVQCKVQHVNEHYHCTVQQG